MSAERISIKGLTTANLVILGLLAITLSIVIGIFFRDAAFESQTNTVSRIVEVAGSEVIKQLDALAVDLGTSTQRPNDFRKALQTIDSQEGRQELVLALNDQFHQRFVTSGQLSLIKLRVYDNDLKFLIESSEGAANVPSQMPAALYDQAKNRSGAERFKSLGVLWAGEHHGYYSVLVPIGGLKLLGYLEVITSPAFNLKHVGEMLKTPTKVTNIDGKISFQDESWQSSSDGVTLPISHTFRAENGDAIVTVEVLENVAAFTSKFRGLLLFSGLTFAGLIGAGLLFSLWMMSG